MAAMASNTQTTGTDAGSPPSTAQQSTRSLVISELSARFEKDKDLIGSQDPYFTLTLSGDTVTTRVIKSGGLNPVWDKEEGYRLHDRGEHPELLVHAWNKNTLLKDSSLGEGKIPMLELGPGHTHTVPLFDKKGNRTGEFIFKAKEEQGSYSDDQATGTETGVGAGAATGAAAAREASDYDRAGRTGELHKTKDTSRDTSRDTNRAAEVRKTKDTSRDAGRTGELRKDRAAAGQEQEYAAQQQGQQYMVQPQGQQYATQQHGQQYVAQPQGQQYGDQYAAQQQGQQYGTQGQQYGAVGATSGPGQAGGLRDAGASGTATGQTGELRSSDQYGDAAAAGVAGGAVGAGLAGAALAGNKQRGATDGTGQGSYSNTIGGQTSSTQALGGGAVATTTTNKRDTTDVDVDESEEHYKRQGDIAAGAPIPDIPSSDDHWQRSLDAAAEARRQAQLVERNSQVTHDKLMAAQEATVAFEKARRDHLAIQDKIAALDLEAKRAAFNRLTEQYEAARARIGKKEAEVDAAQMAANELRATVNKKGEALQAEVEETKLHQARLADLDAEIARIKAAYDEAAAARNAFLADITPKRQRHANLQEEFRRVQMELEGLRRRRAELDARESALAGDLDVHHRELQTTEADLAELEEMGRKRAADAEARRGDVASLEGELLEVQRHLADHRQRIGVLKQETEASLAQATQVEQAAEAKERELAAVQSTMGQQEQAAGEAQRALDAAQASVQPLQENITKQKDVVDREHNVVEELHRKLGMAKEEVDRAQARKEELWERAKWHGEQADKTADKHFLYAHKETEYVAPGGSTVDPSAMTAAGSTTKGILEKAGEKIGL